MNKKITMELFLYIIFMLKIYNMSYSISRDQSQLRTMLEENVTWNKAYADEHDMLLYLTVLLGFLRWETKFIPVS